MKLVKLFNKLSAVALAASLVVGFASCSTTTDDPFNPNAPLTLEEYVKSEIKKAIENGGAQAKPEDPSKPGKPSGSLKEPKSLEFHVNANSTNAENTMIFVKYDRSAYGAEEEVKVTDAELNLYINDVKVKTYNEIVFALDEYGAEITSRGGQIEDPKARKEYKAKLSVGKAVKSGETVKIELVKASVVKVGAASDKITLANLQFALIDTDESVKYYKELAPNAEQFRNICTLEDLTTGEDTESKPGEEQKPGENPTPTPDEKPEPGEESARPAIGDVVYSATGDSLIVVLPQNIYGEPAKSHGIQVTKVGILPKGAKAGETYKIVLKGTASGAFSANVQFLNKGWQGLGDKATVANFTTEDFNITAYYTFGFDTEDGYMFVIGNDDVECTEKTLTLTEFSITRENKPAGGENNNGGEGDNGAGESTSKTYGLCKKYTVTTTKDVAAGNFAFVLQIDNDGEQSEDGLKIDVTDFEMEVKVGEEEPFTFTRDKIAMIPNQWASPNYGVTDCRFKLDGEKTIPSGTVITVQVKKATVSNKGKADSIIYIFNEDGVDGQYGQYVAPSDNYKSIFAANEI
ncbi:MAG: hypothetical protein SOT45_07450 [Treponema sp.]|nr:hypothetical protein [Treponema sp.]